MNNQDIIKITVIIIVILLFKIYIYPRVYNRYHNLVLYKSDIDDVKYAVRDNKDKQQASNLLARIKNNIVIIKDYLNDNINKYPEYSSYIKQLNSNLSTINISESDEFSNYTSYSVNKGEKIVFCLRAKNGSNKLHDLNLIMYVVLHEMAHVACPEYGHTDLFKHIFKFLTNIAISLNLYNKVDFNRNPVEYCGLNITESVV